MADPGLYLWYWGRYPADPGPAGGVGAGAGGPCRMASKGGGAPPGRSLDGLSLICLLTSFKAAIREVVSPMILYGKRTVIWTQARERRIAELCRKWYWVMMQMPLVVCRDPLGDKICFYATTRAALLSMFCLSQPGSPAMVPVWLAVGTTNNHNRTLHHGPFDPMAIVWEGGLLH